MTQFNNELYAGFLPEAGDARFEGKRGFYPAMTAEEYRALPLPMKCATWDARVQYVIFDSYFRDYELSGNVLGTQGGFRGHIPENCKKRDDGTWGLFPLDRTADRKQIIRVAF